VLVGKLEFLGTRYLASSQQQTQPRLRQAQGNLPLFELSRVLVCLDHVASIIVNANHSMIVTSCRTLRIRLHL
jgi:hypothetical protein